MIKYLTRRPINMLAVIVTTSTIKEYTILRRKAGVNFMDRN